MTRTVSLFLFMVFALNTTVTAHAIRFEVDGHYPAARVHVFFSKAAPLVNARVEVFAPGSDKVYQTGRTDQAGYFAFVPSESGDWTVRVDDERGHRGSTLVSIADDHLSGDAADEAADEEAATIPAVDDVSETVTYDRIPTVYKIIFGLALIFGLTGIFYGVQSRKTLKNKQQGN